LNAFIEERESWIGDATDAREVTEFVERFAQNEGYERGCEMLKLAAMYRDFNIVDYEIYRELTATNSPAQVT
jgi:hypothetical protein